MSDITFWDTKRARNRLMIEVWSQMGCDLSAPDPRPFRENHAGKMVDNPDYDRGEWIAWYANKVEEFRLRKGVEG